MSFKLSLVAIVGALYVLFTRLPGLIRAQATGVIRRRGYRDIRVERAVDPERFHSMFVRRRTEILAALGVLASAGGLITTQVLFAGPTGRSPVIAVVAGLIFLGLFGFAAERLFSKFQP